MKKFLIKNRALTAIALGFLACLFTTLSLYRLNMDNKVLMLLATNWSTIVCMIAILLTYVIKPRPVIEVLVYITTLPNIIAIFVFSVSIAFGHLPHGEGLIYVSPVIYPIVVLPASAAVGIILIVMRILIKKYKNRA